MSLQLLSQQNALRETKSNTNHNSGKYKNIYITYVSYLTVLEVNVGPENLSYNQKVSLDLIHFHVSQE